MKSNKLILLLLILSTKTFADDFSEVSAKFKNEPNPTVAIEIYEQQLKLDNMHQDVYSMYKDLAFLYSMRGDLEKAQEYYEKASYTMPSNPDYSMLLNSIGMLLTMNDIERATKQLDIIFIRSKDPNILIESNYFSSVIAYFNDEIDKSIKFCEEMIIVSDLNDKIKFDKYLSWFIFLNENYNLKFDIVAKQLEKRGYSLKDNSFYEPLTSPLILAMSSNKTIIEPKLVETTVKKNRQIVAGSYSIEESATSTSKKLNEDGFATKIYITEIDGKKFYRVNVLPIEDDFDKTLTLLKAKDYDAFISITK